MNEKEEVFWDVLRILDREGVLPYVMLIGSWSEYIYQHFLIEGYSANLRTTDIDVFYNIQ